VRRSWGIALSRAAWDSLRAAAASGPLRVRVRTKALSYAAVERTVVAEVRGSDRRDERFVLSAHVQEPGANDNASGVGALSEMARVLGVFVKRGQVVPRRTITMLFGNEITQTQNFLADDTHTEWGGSPMTVAQLKPRSDCRGPRAGTPGRRGASGAAQVTEVICRATRPCSVC
jgi:hypothetical protein